MLNSAKILLARAPDEIPTSGNTGRSLEKDIQKLVNFENKQLDAATNAYQKYKASNFNPKIKEQLVRDYIRNFKDNYTVDQYGTDTSSLYKNLAKRVLEDSLKLPNINLPEKTEIIVAFINALNY